MHHTISRLLTPVTGYALILSMIISPLAPAGRAAAAAPQTVSPAPLAQATAPTGFSFTKTATVSGEKDRPEAGDTLRYTLTLTNNSGQDAEEVVLQDVLDPLLSLVPGSLEVTPLVYDQMLSTVEDTPVAVTLTGSDGDGDTLSFSVTGAPAHGALSGTPPDLVYTPELDYAGPDSFNFTASDGSSESPPATISIQVDAANDAPVCPAVLLATAEDTPGSLDLNCTDPDLDALSYEIETSPAHGGAAISGNSLSYTPSPDYNGTDSFTYRAVDGMGASGSAMVTVTVTPTNDPPTAQAQSLGTLEDTPLAITLAGQDPDGDGLSYSVLADPANGALSGSAPDLNYLPNGDFSGTDSFTFQVCDNQAISLCDSSTIDLSVTAVNDAPSFTKGPDVAVAEDTGAVAHPSWATGINTGPADESGQAAAFLVTGNTDPVLFSAGPAVSAAGTLSFTPAANANGTATITVRLVDDGGTANGGVDASPEQSFVITISSVNDAPQVQAGQTFSLDENSAAGTLVGSVAFEDPDSGQSHSFAITGGNTGDAFQIDAATGRISVASAAALDFETTPSFDLTVQVEDDGVPALSGSETITIDLNDLQETPTVGAAEFFLDENSANDVVVGTVPSGDMDAGQNHTFAITSGNESGAFSIDPASGEIRVADSAVLNFETIPVFNLTVSLSDDSTPPHTGSNAVTVRLQNVNEAPRLTAGQAFALDENSANGTTVGTVSAADPDAGETLTFSITGGNTGDAFAIDPASGTLTVNNNTALDYESAAEFILTIQVRDSGDLSHSSAITVDLNDVNEAPAIASQGFSLPENSPAGTSLGVASLTDPDAGDQHTFTITGGNTGGTFAIDAGSGEITVANNLLLDYEGEDHPFVLTVQATDSGLLSASATLTIQVTNVNEAPAISTTSLAVEENSPAGTQAGRVTVAEPDAGQSHTYAITGGTGSSVFTIEADTGIVRVASGASLNYEAVNAYTLTVRATDNGTPALSGTGSLTVRLNNLEEAPLVSGEAYDTIGNTLLEVSPGVAGPSPRVFVQGNLLANDSDPDEAGPLAAIEESKASVQEGSATILENGAFTYLPKAGFQGTDSFTYTVVDQGGSRTTGTVTVNIKGMVWYVKNDAAGGGSGRSNSPFNTLSQAAAISSASSTIYVFAGDGTATGQNSGITLKSGQRLIGAGVALQMPAQVNGGPATTTLLPAGAAPNIGNTAGDGVTAPNTANVEIRGLNISGSSHALLVNKTVTGTGTMLVEDNSLSSSSTGVEIQTNAGTLQLAFNRNTIKASGNAFSLNTSAASGTSTLITGFAGTTIHPDTSGSGIVIDGATFDATPGGPFQVVAAGSTKIGAVPDPIGGAGLVLKNVKGDLSFTGLEIFAGSGAALSMTSSGAFNASTGAGLRFVATPEVGILSATGGPALEINTATVDLQLARLASTNSPTTGVSLGHVQGTVSATAGSIQSPQTTAFEIGGGSAAVSYAGTITNDRGRSVSIGATSGTVKFTGSINGTSVALNNNTGTTGFSGGLVLSSSGGTAFLGVSGGTVSVTGDANTLDAASAAALSLTNTTIGSSGLTFQKISANKGSGSPANGILLNNTGTAGGLKVTGTGSEGTGGTIDGMTADCISLTSTQLIELNDLILRNCSGMGLKASSVQGFILRDSLVEQNGDSNGERGLGFEQLSGNVLIQNVQLNNSFEDGIRVANTTGSLDLTLRQVAFTENDLVYGEDGFQFRFGSSATARLLVENSTFTGLARDGIDGAAEGNAALDLTIQNNQFNGNHSNGGVVLSGNSTAALRLKLANNTFTNNLNTPISLVSFGSSDFQGQVSGNTVSNPITPPTNGYGIYLSQEDSSQMTVELSGNNVQESHEHGLVAESTGAGQMDLTLRNNTLAQPDIAGSNAILDAWRSSGGTNQLCLDAGYAGTPGGNLISSAVGYAGIDMYVADPGSSFQIEGWEQGTYPDPGAHIVTYNPGVSAETMGLFTPAAPGACASPAVPALPAEMSALDEPGRALFASTTSLIQPVSFVTARSPRRSAQAGPETLRVELGLLPAGDTVTLSFDVRLDDALPEDAQQVQNQASLTSSSFAGTLLSDDPATPALQDATVTLLYRPPVAYADSYTTPEETPLVVGPAGVLANDTSAAGFEAKLSAVKDSDPAEGSLVFNADGSFQFTPAKDFNGVATFTYHAEDTQAGSGAATVSIQVTPVNDAPVLDSAGPFSLEAISQAAVDNPGTLVSALLASPGGDPVTDVDPEALKGIAVTAANPAHGTWQYALDGSTWQDFGSPSAGAARLLAADAVTRVRFVPDNTWNGRLEEGLRFRAWDRSQGENGGTLDAGAPAAQTALSAAEAAAGITITGGADLSLAMLAPGSPVIAGTQVEYTLTVGNAGPATATGLTLTDTLPAGVSFVSGPATCSETGGTVTCSLGSLAAGASLDLTLTLATASSLRGSLTNHAMVTSGEPDDDPDNNQAQATIELVPSLETYVLDEDPGDEWNRPVVTTSPNGTRLLGEFGNETVTLTLTGLPEHTRATVLFDLYILRSWDGNQVEWPGELVYARSMAAGSTVGPDRWRFSADGETLLDTTFANWSSNGFYQAYPGNYPGGSYPAQTGSQGVCSLGYLLPGHGPMDATYGMSYDIDHTQDTLTLEFTGSGLQALEDESWGLGNVRVILTGGADLKPYRLYLPLFRR